jgi:hypothetical protein
VVAIDAETLSLDSLLVGSARWVAYSRSITNFIIHTDTLPIHPLFREGAYSFAHVVLHDFPLRAHTSSIHLAKAVQTITCLLDPVVPTILRALSTCSVDHVQPTHTTTIYPNLIVTTFLHTSFVDSVVYVAGLAFTLLFGCVVGCRCRAYSTYTSNVICSCYADTFAIVISFLLPA